MEIFCYLKDEKETDEVYIGKTRKIIKTEKLKTNIWTFSQNNGIDRKINHKAQFPEQKARTTYDNILRMVDDPDVIDPIRFLRQREIVHFQRFGEALRIVQDNLNSKNFYVFNPEFDRK